MSKLGRNDWLVIGGMLLLLVALFMPWFRSEVVEDLMDQMANARAATSATPDTRVIGWHYALGWLAWLLTAAAAAIVLLKLIGMSIRAAAVRGSERVWPSAASPSSCS